MKKQNIEVHIPIAYLGHSWKGNFDKLPPNETFNLVLDYPFVGTRKHNFPIKTGKKGLGLIALLAKIGSAYEKIYEDPYANGVFGHNIDDLSLSGIVVDYNKKMIKLTVDS